MKKLFAFFMMISSVHSIAKDEVGGGGNGGGAFVCRNTAGKIISSKLVDLYEANAQYGLVVKRDSRLTLDEQIDLAAFRIQSTSNSVYLEIEPHLAEVRQILRPIPNAQLENTKDFDIIISPKTCSGGVVKFEQLANYTDDGQLIVDEEIWKSLPTTDKAALYIHEAVYSYLRKEDKVVTSRLARKITAYAFSNPTKSSFKLLLDTAVLSGEYKCQEYADKVIDADRRFPNFPNYIMNSIDSIKITAEIPTLGEITPVYNLEVTRRAPAPQAQYTFIHNVKLKEVANGEFNGVTTAVLRYFSNYMTLLSDGKGYLRRLSDGTFSTEFGWVIPADSDYIGPSIDNPQWLGIKKITGCRRIGPVNNN